MSTCDGCGRRWSGIRPRRDGSSRCGASGTGTSRPVTELLVMTGAALGGALLVALPGAVVLRLLRGRSIVAHVAVLVAVVVLAVLAGVIGVARAMFISHHDLRVLLIVISLAGAVSLTVGWWLGRPLAADAVWADEARVQERRAEARRP